MADKFINATELMTELAMLYKHADWSPRECHFSLFDMQMNIDGMKPADVVPVVRCKDCEYWQIDWAPSTAAPDFRYCGMIDGCTQAHDYCSKGEKKDGDPNA